MTLHNLLLIIYTLASASFMFKTGVDGRSLFLFIMPVIVLYRYWSKNVKVKNLDWHEFFLIGFLGFYGVQISILSYDVWVKGNTDIHFSSLVGGLFGGLIALSFYQVQTKQ